MNPHNGERIPYAISLAVDAFSFQARKETLHLLPHHTARVARYLRELHTEGLEEIQDWQRLPYQEQVKLYVRGVGR